MTRLRSITVSIEVDTNKATTSRELTPYDDESVEDFAARVAALLVDLVEGATA